MTRFDRDWLLSGTTLWLLFGAVSLVVIVGVGVVGFAEIDWRFATFFGV